MAKQKLSNSFAYASLACSLAFWLVFGLYYLLGGLHILWISQTPSVTNAIEISDMRKGTGCWVKKATGK